MVRNNIPGVMRVPGGTGGAQGSQGGTPKIYIFRGKFNIDFLVGIFSVIYYHSTLRIRGFKASRAQIVSLLVSMHG